MLSQNIHLVIENGKNNIAYNKQIVLSYLLTKACILYF